MEMTKDVEKCLQERRVAKEIVAETIDKLFNEIEMPLHDRISFIYFDHEFDEMLATPVDDRDFKEKLLRLVNKIGKSEFAKEGIILSCETAIANMGLFYNTAHFGQKMSKCDQLVVDQSKAHMLELNHEKQAWARRVSEHEAIFNQIDETMTPIRELVEALPSDSIVATLRLSAPSGQDFAR